jgi:signal transduction histidine kinase
MTGRSSTLSSLLFRRMTFEILFLTALLSALTVGVLVWFLVRFQTMQVDTWLKSFPASVLPHLVESDYFSVQSKATLLYANGLFKAVCVTDPKGTEIICLPATARTNAMQPIDIRDEAGFLWGKFEYAVDASLAADSIWAACIILLFGLVILFLVLRKRMSTILGSRLAPFRQLLQEIESITRQISNPREKTISKLASLPSSADASEEELAVNRVMLKLLKELDDREEKLLSYAIELERKKYLDELSKTAAQVSHDIRSPLTALMMVQSSLTGISEDTRLLIREAINRIQEISYTLEKKRQDERHDLQHVDRIDDHSLEKAKLSDEPRAELLSMLIDTILIEKRTELRSRPEVKLDFKMGAESYKAFAHVVPSDFKRLLSNLINNSAEAIGSEGGTICVELAASQSDSNSDWLVRIVDDGCGIPKNLLPRLGERGATFNKTGGTGLGLHHALTCIQHWGGTMRITSEVGQGTRIDLVLPQAPQPPWFARSIEIAEDQELIILDDDSSIHQVWERRLSEYPAIRCHHFHSGAKFRSWASTQTQEWLSTKAVFLFDYELFGESESGLDLVEAFHLTKHVYLISSHCDEPLIRARCERLGTRLVPKALARFVPFTLRDRRVETWAQGIVPRESSPPPEWL